MPSNVEEVVTSKIKLVDEELAVSKAAFDKYKFDLFAKNEAFGRELRNRFRFILTRNIYMNRDRDFLARFKAKFDLAEVCNSVLEDGLLDLRDNQRFSVDSLDWLEEKNEGARKVLGQCRVLLDIFEDLLERTVFVPKSIFLNDFNSLRRLLLCREQVLSDLVLFVFRDTTVFSGTTVSRAQSAPPEELEEE